MSGAPITDRDIGAALYQWKWRKEKKQFKPNLVAIQIFGFSRHWLSSVSIEKTSTSRQRRLFLARTRAPGRLGNRQGWSLVTKAALGG